MGDEKVTMTVADLRRMIGEEVARATNSHSAVSASPEIDWKARAIAAERSLSHLARGERVGRAVGSLTVQPGPVARTQFGGLVERARGDAPTLATVAEACLTESLDERSDKATKAQLIENLAAVINAAEADGLITNPIARSAAGWR